MASILLKLSRISECKEYEWLLRKNLYVLLRINFYQGLCRIEQFVNELIEEY